MFHWFGVVQNTRGDALPGWQVALVDLSGVGVTIFADENGTVSRMTGQEGSQIKEFTGPTAAATASSPISFGGVTVGGTRDAVFRISAIAYFTRSLTFAEIAEVWAYISDDLTERGL